MREANVGLGVGEQRRARKTKRGSSGERDWGTSLVRGVDEQSGGCGGDDTQNELGSKVSWKAEAVPVSGRARSLEGKEGKRAAF